MLTAASTGDIAAVRSKLESNPKLVCGHISCLLLLCALEMLHAQFTHYMENAVCMS